MKYIVFLLVFWLFWPGSMFVFGIVFESRILPIWKHQSKAFIPGDFCIGIMFLGIKILRDNGYKPDDYPLNTFKILLIVATLIVTISIQDKDTQAYPPRAAKSPTKKLHDCVGYGLFPFFVVYSGWPIVFLKTPYVLIFWGALAAFITFVAWDNKRGFTKEDIRYRHPDDWKPIWVTKKLKHY